MTGLVNRTLLGLVLLAVSQLSLGESLYREETFAALTSDAKARGVGDIVTVLVVEAASAESRAVSSGDSGFDVTAGVTDASGVSRGGLSVESGTSGAGLTSRAGKLTAMVSTRVDQVLPSGYLQVRGDQLITINGEQQRISVQGVVRPRDITPDNTVLSSRLTNARIEYIGEGWVARNQRPGLFSRLFQFLGF